MAVTKIKASTSGDLGTGLERNARKHVAEALSHLLAGTYLTQLKTQYYHWNVTGPNFSSLHTLFETQYDGLSAAVDEIAERIRALGFPTPGTFREFSGLANIAEDKSLPSDWSVMVKNLLAANEALTRHLREQLPHIQEAGDEGTADLFIRRLQEHEKAAWMLRSHLA